MWFFHFTHTYLASMSSGLNVVATLRPNIGLNVATSRPMFRFGRVTLTSLASTSPGLNVAWPQRRLASMSPGLNVAWPQCRGLNVAGLNVAWHQCPIVPGRFSFWRPMILGANPNNQKERFENGAQVIVSLLPVYLSLDDFLGTMAAWEHPLLGLIAVAQLQLSKIFHSITI